MNNNNNLGFSGSIAAYFQNAAITPLLTIIIVLLGIFALYITPKEEEPQIAVTMADIIIPFPGASINDVEHMVSIPAEQVISQLNGIEHIMSVSNTGMSIITVQFKVGVPRNKALLDLYDVVNSNSDWLPSELGVQPPIIKAKGIDDVPIMALTLFTEKDSGTSLQQVAHSLESELKKIKGTKEITTIGGNKRTIVVDLDISQLRMADLTVKDVSMALINSNLGIQLGELHKNNKTIYLETGPFLETSLDVNELIVGVKNNIPIFLKDIAIIKDGEESIKNYVWYGEKDKTYQAITLAITKQSGQNASEVTQEINKKINTLKNTLIPDDVKMVITRDYGKTASDKANKLIQKLAFATLSVVILVLITIGHREALIVGIAVILTLIATLFASWAWGFTLNRVSLFALIFSIGILVDDAIVVVENIHRHQKLSPDKNLTTLIPIAVSEVGGATILATLTVIAALLPMAFITGLMGPYMSPIPINASLGMLISLIIAFTITPWLSNLLLKKETHLQVNNAVTTSALSSKIFNYFLDEKKGSSNRGKLLWLVLFLIGASLLLPITKHVVLKMLPFDNKSEFQVVVDMPNDSPLENTLAMLQEMGSYISSISEVKNYQIYAGIASPISFNGLVRQYYFRNLATQGDIQVNLVDKHERSRKSHNIVLDIRPELNIIAKKYNAKIKVVEVPPGPPVLAPIVAEVYGPTNKGRTDIANKIEGIFALTDGIVDVDSTAKLQTAKYILEIDRKKASLLGITQKDIVDTLLLGKQGQKVTYLHDTSKYPVPVTLRLPTSIQGDLDELLSLTVRSNLNHLIPIREIVLIKKDHIENTIYHKDLSPVVYVVGDMAGKLDSPLYGMFFLKDVIEKDNVISEQFYTKPPYEQYNSYSIKWDGEWQITYETFRDMGLAYAIGLIFIYLLVVIQFKNYVTPLIIMAPIPLTIIGILPGHAILGQQFTATSMIGMIALAGIIVRNSILLVDFIKLQIKSGIVFKDAVINSVDKRAKPIILTGIAAMVGGFFILDDPIFNGLAISLIFGIFISTLLTLVVIPLLYYTVFYKNYK